MNTMSAGIRELDADTSDSVRGGVVIIPVIMCLQWGAGAAILGGTVGYHLVESYIKENCG